MRTAKELIDRVLAEARVPYEYSGGREDELASVRNSLDTIRSFLTKIDGRLAQGSPGRLREVQQLIRRHVIPLLQGIDQEMDDIAKMN